ncbi:MAG: hypothetical protein WC194_11960 [Mesotoga sp.]|uniref:hypothetical protein n=1 Tax=Mesotoga sp. TaxID=2053577 RepID=UPI003561A044|nr:hypothetical protein [Thermotogota bacterium]
MKSVSIPVIYLDERLAITDGHTRAVAAIIKVRIQCSSTLQMRSRTLRQIRNV